MNELERIAGALEQLAESLATPVQPLEQNYLSREQAAVYLGVPARTIDYLITERRIRYVQVGDQRIRVIRRTDLEKFAEARTVPTAEEEMAELQKRKPRKTPPKSNGST